MTTPIYDATLEDHVVAANDADAYDALADMDLDTDPDRHRPHHVDFPSATIRALEPAEMNP